MTGFFLEKTGKSMHKKKFENPIIINTYNQGITIEYSGLRNSDLQNANFWDLRRAQLEE